jgi:hypothetical protein
VFAALLGIAVLVDLCAYEPVRFMLWQPRQFHMPWLDAWPALEPSLANMLFVRAWTVLACFGAGALFWGRSWGAWLVLTLYVYAFLDQQPNYTNNGYLLLILLCVAGMSELRGDTPVWPRRIGQLSLCALYLGAGLSKLNADFLSGAILHEALLHYGARYATWIGLSQSWLFASAACAAAALELALCAGLWWAPTRRLLIPLGLVFHLVIEVFMPVRFFFWMCAAGYVLFVDVPALEALVARARTLARPWVWLAGSVCSAVLLESPVYGVAPGGVIGVSVGIAASTILLRRARGPVLKSRSARPLLGLAAVSGMLCLQVFCLAKPAFGWSKRFAWQMFSELLILRIEPQVRTARGYRTATFPGADARYRTDGFRYHWTSWSEERIYLQGYAHWLAETYALRDVRVLVRYRRNREPEQQATFLAHNPRGSEP